MKQLYLILPAIVIFISGCTYIETGNGLVIQNIEPDISESFSGEVVTFFVRIKNTGSQTASDVHAELLGLDQDWYNEGIPVGDGPWAQGEKLPEEVECRYISGGSTLIPPDPMYGTEGQGFTCSWKYIAPHIPTSTHVTYNPSARVYYKYQSETVKLVNILPREELRRLQDSGNPLPMETISQSRSPVNINVEAPGPIRTSQTTITFPLRISLNNVDSGIVCYPNTIDSCKGKNINWNKIRILLDLPSNMQVTECSDEMVLDLFQGKSNEITCSVVASGIDMSMPNQATIRVTGDYVYMLDKSTSITVSGKQSI